MNQMIIQAALIGLAFVVCGKCAIALIESI